MVHETIPEALRPEVEAALAWWNAREAEPFEVTGIVDPEASLASTPPRELRLVLCGGDQCRQERFVVGEASADGAFEVSLAAPAHRDEEAIPPELDPPPGAMRGWLDRVLERHRFVVLLFYRGYW